MNKLVPIVFVAISLALPGRGLADEHEFLFSRAGDYPIVRKEASSAADFVSQGWKVLAKASGDLNGDKLGDAALVVQGNLATYKQKNDGLGGDFFDTNPRMLLVLLQNPGGNGFRLAKTTRNIVGCADSPTMDEPFEEIAIKNDVLEIHVQSFYNAGGWSASQYRRKRIIQLQFFDRKDQGGKRECAKRFQTGRNLEKNS
jgi:hypothetical protein